MGNIANFYDIQGFFKKIDTLYVFALLSCSNSPVANMTHLVFLYKVFF